MRNCYWRAGFEARTRYPARCSLAVIEKLALLLAKGRNLLVRVCRRCGLRRRRRGGARADANSVGEIA